MKIDRIYKSIGSWVFYIILLMLIVSCSSQRVRNTPYPQLYEKIDGNYYNNGYPKYEQPWVVFSDRSKNKINPTKKGGSYINYKESYFLEPFVVLQHQDSLFKIAEYKPDLINDGKFMDKKKLKVLGWIPEERLLLWNNGLKNSETGFTLKAAIVVNHKDVIEYSEKYIEKDSAIVFSAPDLVDKTHKKIDIGSIVYVYKQSEDKNSFLIGGQPSVILDSIKNNIYGWVSKNMVSVWGERASFKIIKTDSLEATIKEAVKTVDTTVSKKVLSLEELNQRTGIESIYPLQNSDSKLAMSDKQFKFFANVFNYEKNKIYNVLGNPIFYKRYKEIISNNKKLNVVFVLDVSKNNKFYISVAKSLLQELQLNFLKPSYFSTVKFGGVVYKQNSCGISPLYSSLSTNYRDVVLFFEKKVEQLDCNDKSIVQPVDRGVLSATRVLSGAEDETNIIILIGTTANHRSQTKTVINALTHSNARIIFFQTQSKSTDAYNDFVLLGEKSITNSARNITEIKKEKIVNQNDLFESNDYNITFGEKGIYFLDYPKKSMTANFVLFPKKGQVMQGGELKTAIDTLLVQVTNDNRHINDMLNKYFRSEIGVDNTILAAEYRDIFPVYDNLIPTSIASSLLNKDTSFLINGVLSGNPNSLASDLQYGILLNEHEYDQLRGFYTDVYKKVLSEGKFNKRKALNNYISVILENNQSLKKMIKRKLKKTPMNDLVKLTTGFHLNGNLLMEKTPRELMGKKVKKQAVLEYFEQFRELAKKLGVSKGGSSIRINYKGQVLYWIGKEYIPMLN